MKRFLILKKYVIVTHILVSYNLYYYFTKTRTNLSKTRVAIRIYIIFSKYLLQIKWVLFKV